SCSGGAGQYQCENAATSNTTLCSNYPSYTTSPGQLECVCPTQGHPQDAGTVSVSDLSQASCGQSVCTANQVCVHYPACTTGGSTSAGCESNNPMGFPN